MFISLSTIAIVCTQSDGGAMGPPWDHFQQGLSLLPKVTTNMKRWYRFVDDTYRTIESNAIHTTVSPLNACHTQIKFMFEQKSRNKLPLLDTLLIRTDSNIVETSVYQKETNGKFIQCKVAGLRQIMKVACSIRQQV